MTVKKRASTFETVVDCLAVIWSPASEAMRLREQLNVHSLEETAAVAERTGCKVCLADLPEKVSGFAEIIEGTPHIVLNRSKSRNNLQYTLSHELGHQVLHLNPSRSPDGSEVTNLGIQEWQAHVFAISWIISFGNDPQRDEVLRSNPESYLITALGLFVSVLVVVIALMTYIFSKLSPAEPPELSESHEHK